MQYPVVKKAVWRALNTPELCVLLTTWQDCSTIYGLGSYASTVVASMGLGGGVYTHASKFGEL